ncbi:MFS transporter [Mucilaginibacter kameinonensis]|uniref:MFS transporter n=1 Tax=Mucilaginibacter kameinonensis TaxID=452286 RepID=UPI000EF7A155|nr:MFS transporter [Mucilaginibacter kameinonensis]
MELYDLFYKWVPAYVRLPVLFLLFFCVLSANGVYLGNANLIANNLGVYAESFTEAYNAVYIGMGLGLIFHYRLKLRFSSKQLVLFGFIMMFLTNLICATTSNTVVFIAACFILGFCKISALADLYVIWMLIWANKKFDATKIYPFVYFTALCGINFLIWLTAYIATLYDWRHAYIVVLVLLLLSILSVILLVENHELKNKLPLKGIDYPGLVLLGASLLCLNYAVVNGHVEDWLSSKNIAVAFIAAAITMLLFIKRQLSVKSPLYDFGLFQHATFRKGLIYFLLLGVFLPGSFQTAFSGGVLGYDAATNSAVALYMIPGIITGCAVCFIWYYFKLNTDVLIMLGFLSFLVYYMMLYNSFSNSFAMAGFALPSLFKGFGTAILYIAAGLFAVQGFDIKGLVMASGTVIIIRNFFGSGIITAIYTHLLYTERIRQVNDLASHMDVNSFYVHSYGAGLIRRVQGEATLNASKELSGFVVIAGVILMICLLINFLLKKIKGSVPA